MCYCTIKDERDRKGAWTLKISIDHETNRIRIDLSLFELKTMKSEDKDIARKLMAVRDVLE